MFGIPSTNSPHPSDEEATAAAAATREGERDALLRSTVGSQGQS